jgi:hypothetical protein
MTGDRRENENLLLIRLGAVVTGAASGIRTACVRALKVQGERTWIFRASMFGATSPMKPTWQRLPKLH